MKDKRMQFRAALAIAAGAVLAAQGASVPSLETFISHRGESVDAPENTLPAYRTAVSRGFGFECDIYLSKDGRVFTFHDRTLTRTSGATTRRGKRSRSSMSATGASGRGLSSRGRVPRSWRKCWS